MALQGTLEDCGIIELLQVPYNGKRTCQLTLTGDDGEAFIYYDQGQLIHAQFKDLMGEKVIEEILDWSKGNFIIRQDILPQVKTISKDLHSLLLLLVKKKDEKMTTEQKIEEQPSKLNTELEAELVEFLSSSQNVVHIAIVDKAGNVIAKARDPQKTQEQIDEVIKLVSNTISTYPRRGLSRTFYEDDLGITGAIKLADSSTVVMVAERNQPLGAFLLELNKLANQLNRKTSG